MKKFEGKYELTTWINDMKWHCLQLSHGVNYKSYLLFLNSEKVNFTKVCIVTNKFYCPES